MKLLTVEMSRVTFLFRMTRLSGQLYLPQMLYQLSDRYHFTGKPDSLAAIEEKKAVFRHGRLDGNAIDSFEIYDDGIVVASRSDTEFVDRFINDLVKTLEKHHGISLIETHAIGRIYESTLLVQTNHDVFKPLSTFFELRGMIENMLHDSTNLRIPYQDFGIAFSANQAGNPVLKPIPFRFERKEGIDFSHHQFFTVAPLKTKQHLKILERLEQLVA